MKVVSLLPAATEMLCAMGAEELLVGVSHECDFPPSVSRLPRLTRSRLEVDGSSLRIHESMSELVANALSIYEVDAERLRALEPDVIVTQDLCDVCAVSYDDVCAAVRGMTHDNVQIVRLHPRRLTDIYDDIQRVGDAVGCGAQAKNVVESLVARMQHLSDSAVALPVVSVLLVEWLQPVMVGGLWSQDLARAAGARALATEAGEHALTLNDDDLAGLDPDVVVVKPCGFNLERTMEEIDQLPAYLPWNDWRAVEAGRVFLVDGNAYFNRSGPRIVDSAEILAGCAHEQTFASFRKQYASVARRARKDLSIGAFDE